MTLNVVLKFWLLIGLIATIVEAQEVTENVEDTPSLDRGVGGTRCNSTEWICNDECISKRKPCFKLNCTVDDSPCSSSGNDDNCKTCFGDLTFNCNTNKCENPNRVEHYCCDGNCIKTINPCSGQCPAIRPLGCDDQCFYGPEDLKRKKQKWICDGQCLNLTTPCAGNRCPESNMEVNCRGECELEQTFYECNGACQSVNEQCQGECSSKGRPWKCPSNNQTCVSNYLCSLYGISTPEHDMAAKQCPYILTNYKDTCERPEGLKEIKCKFPKVACTGHRKQCIDRSGICNGILDCMDRSDESGCKKFSSDFDPELFKPCSVDGSNNYNNLSKLGNAGFKCGDDTCLDQSLWCGLASRKPVWIDFNLRRKCGEVLDHVRNGRLCSNQTFWNSMTCSDPSAPYRCRGKYPGECSAGPNIACNGEEYSECHDKSDMVCDIKKKICDNDQLMFTCADNKTCIHKSLVHDGYQHCQDGSDEFNLTCKAEQQDCKNRYSNITICATYCDGIDDLCDADADESNCNFSSNLTVAYVVALIVITLVLGEVIYRVGSRLCRDPEDEGQSEMSEENENLFEFLESCVGCRTISDAQFRTFGQFHDSDKYRSDLKSLTNLVLIADWPEARRVAERFYSFEKSYHNDHQEETDLCLKRNLEINVGSKMTYKVGHHSRLDRSLSLGFQQDHICDTFNYFNIALVSIVKLYLTITQKMPELVWVKFFVIVVAQTVIFYADLVKDVVFLVVYNHIVRPNDFLDLKFQVLLLSIFSIAAPFFLNFVLVTKECSKYLSKRSNWFYRRLLPLLFAPISPALVLYLRNRLTTLQEIQSNKHWGQAAEARARTGPVTDYSGSISKLEKLFSKLRKNETSFEHFTQAVLLIIVISLKFSDSPTQEFPSQLFAGGSVNLLILSAIWSIVSIILGFLHCTTLNKGNFLPVRGTAILAAFAFLSLIGRLTSVVLCFAPGLGLVDLLEHWKMGQLETSKSTTEEYDIVSGNIVTFEKAWENFRINSSSTGTDYSYTEFTIFPLEITYIMFLFLIVLHYACLFVIKYFTALNFKSKRSMTSKFYHVLTQLVYPSNYQDWDEVDDTQEVKSSWLKNCLEMKLLCFLFAIEHLVLCGPIFILNYKILQRNKRLQNYFPPILEETISTRNVWLLSVILPIFYIVLPFLQYYLFQAFHKIGHPWAKILNYELKKPEKQDLDASNDDLLTDPPL